MRLNSWAGTEGSPVSSFKCDRPSHPDWGRLGVVRAAGADNRWQGPAVLQEDRVLAPCQRNPPAKYTVQAPGLEGNGALGLGLSTGGG